MISARIVILVSVLAGIALELGIHALSGRREAWDSPEFWTIGMPAAAAISALVGFLSRRRDWLWTLLIVPSQTATMMLRSGEVGNLWPLTIVFSAILSAPFLLVAFIASRFRRRPS